MMLSIPPDALVVSTWRATEHVLSRPTEFSSKVIGQRSGLALRRTLVTLDGGEHHRQRRGLMAALARVQGNIGNGRLIPSSAQVGDVPGTVAELFGIDGVTGTLLVSLTQQALEFQDPAVALRSSKALRHMCDEAVQRRSSGLAAELVEVTGDIDLSGRLLYVSVLAGATTTHTAYEVVKEQIRAVAPQPSAPKGGTDSTSISRGHHRDLDLLLAQKPPVPFLLRRSTCDTEVAGVRVDRGTVIAVDLHTMFSERHSDESGTFSPPPRAVFGHGPHFCPGAELARLVVWQCMALGGT